jgi:hypothetical protein
VALDALRLEKEFEGTIALEPGKGEIEVGDVSDVGPQPEDVRARLSRIIHEMNEIYGLNIPGERGAEFAEHLIETVASSDAMVASLRANPDDMARMTFETLADDYIEDSIYTYQRIYKALNQKPEIRQRFMSAVWPEVQRRTSRELSAGV